MDNLELKDKLIYDLIFSESNDFRIDISDYITDIYRYDKFIDEIKKVLKKSKVSIIREKTNLDTNSVIWEIKVSK
jgi:hypothetical protein